MDSTMLYSLVLEHLGTKQQLLNLLPSFNSQLLPNSKLSTQKMTDQQIFSQILTSVSKSLKQSEKQKEELMAHLSQEPLPQQESEDQNQLDDEAGRQNHQEYEKGQQSINQEPEEDNFEQIEQQENEEDLADEPLREDENDVGLYGEQIDEEDMQSYENEGNSQQDRQFEQELMGKRTKQEEYEGQDQAEDALNDQFDHFREIELQNNEEHDTQGQERNTLQKQIQSLEKGIIEKKQWVLKGEVKAAQRPLNSLLEYDLQFSSGIRLDQQITPEFNSDLQKMIKQRILDELYDDRVRYQHSHVLREQYSSLKEVSTEKSKLGLSQLYQAEFKNHLGLGQNKQDKLKTQIYQAFKEVNFFLDSLSNLHFTPRPTVGSKAEAIISEEKVPLNMWNKTAEVSAKHSKKFQSEKEEDHKAKRLKNKRIARQRKKEQSKKKLNKKIEYGGLTKFEAKAIAKKNKNNLNSDTKIKFNKSARFFEEMNKDKSKKPNPNINKLKI